MKFGLDIAGTQRMSLDGTWVTPWPLVAPSGQTFWFMTEYLKKQSLEFHEICCRCSLSWEGWILMLLGIFFLLMASHKYLNFCSRTNPTADKKDNTAHYLVWRQITMEYHNHIHVSNWKNSILVVMTPWFFSKANITSKALRIAKSFIVSFRTATNNYCHYWL